MKMFRIKADLLKISKSIHFVLSIHKTMGLYRECVGVWMGRRRIKTQKDIKRKSHKETKKDIKIFQ